MNAFTPIETDPVATQRLFEQMRDRSRTDGQVSFKTRIERLKALEELVVQNEAAFVEAVNADFGSRPELVTTIGDFFFVIAGIRHMRRHLRRWMKPKHAPTALHFLPAVNRIVPQPLGVVGVISPWNYPIQLALLPAAAALAAGNRVMIKPSELTPRTSALMAKLIDERFAPIELTVVQGGPEEAASFSALPFDHLFFTGSTQVGRKVAQAAAANLTPVTLELGGKSPAIIDQSAKLKDAAHAIAHGKLLNAGQTCIAPDYVLTPEDRLEETIDALRQAANALYPDYASSPDYTSLVSDRHFDRLTKLVAAAREAGVRVETVQREQEAAAAQRKMPLTLLINPPNELAVMQEELFGPVLPIVTYGATDEAIAHINAGDRPLALYWFGTRGVERRRYVDETVAGGMTVNDTLWHIAQEDMPFGGVGASGQGAYHGETGFQTFSHMKPVMRQRGLKATPLFHPPYNGFTRFLLAALGRIV